MAEIVNLRRARKARKRAEQKAEAADNRARFGRSKAKSREQTRKAMVNKAFLDGKKLD